MFFVRQSPDDPRRDLVKKKVSALSAGSILHDPADSA